MMSFSTTPSASSSSTSFPLQMTSVRVAPEMRKVATLRVAENAGPHAPQQTVLEGALSFVSTGSLEETRAYRLSANDSTIMVRPTDPARLAQLDRYSHTTAVRLGETLTYVQTEIRSSGFESAVELLPVKNRIDPLATITLGEQIATDRRVAMDAAWSGLASMTRRDLPLLNRPIPVPVLAQLDLAAQAEGIWAHAARAFELLPAIRPYLQLTEQMLGALDLSAESTLLALYTEGNSLRDWLLVGRALARIRQVGYRYGIGARMLHHAVADQLAGNTPWRHTLRLTQLQVVLQLGHCADV